MEGTISKEEAERLFKEYSNYIYRGALFFTKSREIADDITQEVFVQVIRKYDTYDQTKPIKPWLYRIMLNKVKNVMSRRKYVETLENIVIQGGFEWISDAYTQIIHQESIWAYMNKLSTKTKAVIYLHYYLDMTIEETAKILEVPVGTCKSRLNEGLKKLKKYMEVDYERGWIGNE